MVYGLGWEQMVNDVGKGVALLPYDGWGLNFVQVLLDLKLHQRITTDFQTYVPRTHAVKDLKDTLDTLNSAVTDAETNISKALIRRDGRGLEPAWIARQQAVAQRDRINAHVVGGGSFRRAAKDTRVTVNFDDSDPEYLVIALDTNNLVDIHFDLVIADIVNFIDEEINAYRVLFAEQAQVAGPLKEITIAGGGANDRVFNNMRLVSLDDLNKKWDEIFKPILVAEQAALPAHQFECGLVDYRTGPSNFRGRAIASPRIIIRKSLPIFLLDEDGAYQHYTVQDTVATPVVAAAPAITQGKIWAYRFGPNVTMAACQIKLQGAGARGSGGAMRADRADEVAYQWWGDQQLGILSGLDVALRQGDTNAVTILRYEAAYDPAKLAKKKNLPTTAPAPPPVISVIPISGAAAAVPERGIYDVRKGVILNGIRVTKKKRKGCGTPAAPGAGEALKGGNAETRAQAGSVMRPALSYFMEHDADMAAPADAPQPKPWTGSATQFAPEALKTLDQTSFSASSSGVTIWQQLVPWLRWSGAIRTDQEWCHLLGHGDGGSETPDNFVSGSEHCNTEQLAIECGHRDANIRGLKAKITAYLVPTTRTAPDAFSVEKLQQVMQLLQSPGLRWPYQLPPTVKNMTDLLAMSDAALAAVPIMQPAIQPAFQQGDIETKKFIRRVRETVDSIVYPDPLPLAVMVRYKIYDSQSRKIFDHSFSAQSEGFDINQFNILYWSVRSTVVDLAGNQADKDALFAAKNKKLKKYNDAIAAAKTAAAAAALAPAQ